MSFDRLSLSTVPITPFFNDLQLPEATGFIWKRRERFYHHLLARRVGSRPLYEDASLEGVLDRTNSAVIFSSVSDSTSAS